MMAATRRTIARTLLRGAGMYGAAFLVPRVVRLALVPLLIAAVGMETYGAFVLLSMALPFAHVVCEMGIGTAAMRIAPHEPADRGPHIWSSLLTARVTTALVLATALASAREPLARLLTGSSDHAGGMVIVALTLIPFALDTAFADQLRSEGRHSTLASLTVVRDLCEAAFSLLLVVVWSYGLQGLLFSRLVADVTLLLLLASRCRSSLVARPSLSRIVELVRLGAPIGALYFVMWSEGPPTATLIKAVLGVSATGRYDLALRIVAPVSFGNATLGMVLEPHVYRSYAHADTDKVFSTFLQVYVVLFCTMAFAVAMIAPAIFPVLSPGAGPNAAVIAPPLLFAFVGDGVLRMAGIGADFAKRTGAWVLVVGAHLAVALPATWFLLRPFGLLAAGAAMLAGTLVATEVAYALSTRLYPLKLPIQRAVTSMLVGAIGATLLVGAAGPIAPAAVRVLAVPLFAIVVLGITGLRPRDALVVLAGTRVMPMVPGDARLGGG